MSITEALSRLFLPLAAAIVFVLGHAAYLVRRSIRIDAWPIRSEEDLAGQAAARKALAESRRILVRATANGMLLVVLLLSSLYILETL